MDKNRNLFTGSDKMDEQFIKNLIADLDKSIQEKYKTGIDEKNIQGKI